MLVWATFEHTTVGGHALQPGEEIRERRAPCLSSLVLVGPPVTAIRMYGPARAPRTATAYDKAFVNRATLVVDVCMGYFRAHGCLRACFPAQTRDSRTYGAMPLFFCPRPSAAPLRIGGIQGEVPSAGILRPPMLGSPCHSDTQ